MRQPPRILTWLLNRLLSGSARDSVIGDLIEQHHRGRSSPWYWRQALLAVFLDAFREVAEHKLLTIRAIVVGYAVSEAFMYSTGALVSRFVAGDKALLILLPLCGGCSAAGGWVVSRSHPRSMVVAYIAFCWAASICTFAVYGWLPFMDHQRFPVLAFFLMLDFVVMPLGFVVGGTVGATEREDKWRTA
jgi:hypothetical protein